MKLCQSFPELMKSRWNWNTTSLSFPIHRKRSPRRKFLSLAKSPGFPATIVDAPKENISGQDEPKKEYSPPAFYTEALATAKKENKPLVLDFTASWCEPCQRIISETFVKKNVAELLSECVLLKIDTDEFPDIARHFKVAGLPDIRFLTPDGRQVKKLRGFQAAKPFALELEKLLKSSKKPITD